MDKINSKIELYSRWVILLLVILFFLISNRKTALEIDLEGLNRVKEVSTGVQRVTKLELEDNPDDYLVAFLYYKTMDLYQQDEENNIYLSNERIQPIIEEFASNFLLFIDDIDKYKKGEIDRSDLFWSSENNYIVNTRIIKEVNSYIDLVNRSINRLTICFNLSVVTIGLLLFILLYQNLKELKKVRIFSEEMKIDTTTGVYDKSKCTQMLNEEISINDGVGKVIILFDINNLKNINNTFSYTTGDIVLSNFADALKKSINIFNKEVFIARYVEDEFLVSFNYSNEKEIELYIKEVNFLITEFNRKNKNNRNKIPIITFNSRYNMITIENINNMKNSKNNKNIKIIDFLDSVKS